MKVWFISNLPLPEFPLYYLQAVCLMRLVKTRQDDIFCLEKGHIDINPGPLLRLLFGIL